MNKDFLKFEEEFGRYGSWALWKNDGTIKSIIQQDNFEQLIKPYIVFVGLNASIELTGIWINYHSEANISKKKVWNQEFVKRFADLIMDEKDFDIFRGGYMTDIIKNHYDPRSSDVSKKLKNDEDIVIRNKELFIKEIETLKKIFNLNDVHIICIGNDSFNIIKNLDIGKIYKIPHYSYRKKEDIKKDLYNLKKEIKIN